MEIRENEKILTVKDWLKIQVIMMIPILNILMCVKWLISDKTNVSLKNFVIVTLIMMAIGAAVTMSFYVTGLNLISLWD